MAPPTQAGRFKPRKPAKRIVPGAASAAAESSGGSGGRGGRGGRGRGRGGRGRGRMPMPRGQVFFTGNAPPPAAGAGRRPGAGGGGGRGGAAGASKGGGAKKKPTGVTIKMEGKHESSDEVIVGELEEAIGSSGKGSDKKVSVLEQETRPSLFQDETVTAVDPHFSIADTYDSDSSDEERKQKHRAKSSNPRDALLQPSQLPFPVARLPVGIGPMTERPAMYEEKDITTNALSSPFVDESDAANKMKEQESWFLFQFPTRLPVDVEDTTTPDQVGSTAAAAAAAAAVVVTETAEAAIPLTAPTSVQPVLANAFDDCLRNVSGKLGKLIVYKSGKTVLHMGTSGRTKLIVSEGLPCSFVQQAVAIDVQKSTYIPLGIVGKTVVVTPDVPNAFLGSNN